MLRMREDPFGQVPLAVGRLGWSVDLAFLLYETSEQRLRVVFSCTVLNEVSRHTYNNSMESVQPNTNKT